jgi:hypothetical protein
VPERALGVRGHDGCDRGGRPIRAEQWQRARRDRERQRRENDRSPSAAAAAAAARLAGGLAEDVGAEAASADVVWPRRRQLSPELRELLVPRQATPTCLAVIGVTPMGSRVGSDETPVAKSVDFPEAVASFGHRIPLSIAARSSPRA